MPGLLEKIGPFLRGAGGALAVGANPLIGLLAGPALNDKRVARKQRDKRISAADELAEFISGNVDLPPTEAISELDGSRLTSSGTIPGFRGVPNLQAPGGRQKALGLLAQADPQMGQEVLAEGLLGPRGNERAEPADLRIMDALGLPRTPGGFAQLQDMKAKSGSSGDELLSMLILEQKRLENERRTREEKEAQAEAERVAAERTRQRNTKQGSLNSALSGLQDLAGYNDALEDTFLRPGAFAGSRETALQGFEAIKNTFGGDTTAEREVLTNLDLFEKGAANLLLDLLPKLEGINARTDNRLQQIKKSIADIGTQPGANRKIMADIIDELLSIGEIEGFEIEGRDKFLELSKGLRGSPATGKLTAEEKAELEMRRRRQQSGI